jgi:hypothetical protein
VFRIQGRELDGIYFSGAFRTRAERIAGLGVTFTQVGQRYPHCSQRSWGLGTATRTLLNCSLMATHGRVKEAEARTGLRFPDRLSWLFTNANGASPSDQATGISKFLELRDGRGSAEWTYEVLVVHFGLVPWQWFPFANDGGGNVFFVDTASPDGSVFFCHLDTASPSDRIVPLSETLADLVATISGTEPPTAC